MGEIEFFILLLGAVALLAQLARLLSVPYPIFLVLGGLVIGFVPGLPEIELAPEVIFLIFLPPLLNSAAFSSSPRELRAHLRPISLLAIGLVLVTTLAVAFVAHALIEDLPWSAAFVLGAILAPTDPVAAEAIFRRLGVPERVNTVVGGESLVNDGSALVAYRLAVVAVVSGAFSLAQGGLDFLLVGGGGLLLGLVLARLVLPLWSRLGDPTIMITVSLLLPYVVYIVAEELHVSGILAVVSYGLYQGWRAPSLFSGASTRLQALSFWETLVFLLNSLLFILVGLQFPAILEGSRESSVADLLLYAALVCGVVIGVRLVWFFTVPYLHPVFDRLLRNRYLRAPWQERLVMGWSGMRGAVSLAAALAIPLYTDTGAPFPGRDIIIFLTFCVILVTLVLQGLTLPVLIRSLRIRSDGEGDALKELQARLKASHAALGRLEQLCAYENVPPRSQERMREFYEDRIRRYTAGLEAGGVTEEYSESSKAWRSWRRELIEAERATVISLRDGGEINSEVMRRIERDLDLEESRIGG
jgi:CPA1 family monovalent cation:H+ antiporter